MSKPQFGEPWEKRGVSDSVQIRSANRVIARVRVPKVPEAVTHEYAARITACVNACAGLSDEQLKRVRAVNELYKELSAITDEWGHMTDANTALGRIMVYELIPRAKKAIALAEGKEVGE